MAKSVTNGNNLAIFRLILAVLFVDIYCGHGLVPVTSTTSSPPPNNAWNKPNQNLLVTSSPLSEHTSTTPWPDLGAKRQPNRQQTSTSQSNAQDRNVNVQLSYNTNPSQSRDSPQKLNSPNKAEGSYSGLALSYGLGQATHVPNPKKNLNQNVAAKPVQQNANQKGVWSDAGKTQLVVNSLGSSTPKAPSSPTPPTPTSTQPTIQVQPSPAGSSKPANDENEELRQFFEQLIRKDNGNMLQQITVNYQGKTTSRSTVDEAPLPLLEIRPTVYQVPSVSKLLALHNNYILETNVNEHSTPQERLEENDLLDTIVGSPVMQTARNFLVQKGVLSKDPKDFRDKLKEIWFTMYSRGGGKIGSSGFEHVFLTEIKQQDVSGLHNWLYFKDAEAKGLANYLGYTRKLELGNKGVILKHHFTFNGLDKPVGSMFIGTSPELEIALYSTCFLLKPDQVCPMRYDGKNFIVRTYTFRYRGKNMIGSAFPEI